jgi:hypothetical protein
MRSFCSGRRFSCLEALLALFLSAPISLNAQIGFPGGGLPIPGSRGRTQQNQSSDTQMARVSYSGVLNQLDNTSLVLQVSDGRILTIKVSPETKFYKDSKEIEPTDVKPGDHLSVQANEDQQNYLYATAVTLQQAASAQTSQTSAPSPASGDGRPQLKRAVSQTSGDSATQQTSAVGQAQASSPQSQPAQSAASAPPPPTQSQAQSPPPCSDVRPILKRGQQAALPPCADPPPAASPPADSVPTRSLSPAESLIERAREAAFEFSGKLPNFICKEFMSRFTQRGREEMPLDVVSAEIVYANAQESYRNVKINDRPTDKGLQEIGGSWSTGEFASTLLELFRPDTYAQFRSGGASHISGLSAQVYDFQVRSENSHWKVQSGSQTLVAAYGGSVWVDPKTGRVLRIEMQARNIPSDFPMDTAESAVDYSYVMIGGTSFLLPVHAESLGCERGTRYCSHNIIDFRNYHEFTVDFRIGP